MKCFKCNITVTNCKGKYGYYYFCPKCGNTFETAGQTRYNSRNSCKVIIIESEKTKAIKKLK